MKAIGQFLPWELGTRKQKNSLQAEKRVWQMHREKPKQEERQGFWVPEVLLTVSDPNKVTALSRFHGMPKYSGQCPLLLMLV